MAVLSSQVWQTRPNLMLQFFWNCVVCLFFLFLSSSSDSIFCDKVLRKKSTQTETEVFYYTFVTLKFAKKMDKQFWSTLEMQYHYWICWIWKRLSETAQFYSYLNANIAILCMSETILLALDLWEVVLIADNSTSSKCINLKWVNIWQLLVLIQRETFPE